MENTAKTTTRIPPFNAYVEDRRYLKNVSPKTLAWFMDAWKAFGTHIEPVLANPGPRSGRKPFPLEYVLWYSEVALALDEPRRVCQIDNSLQVMHFEYSFV